MNGHITPALPKETTMVGASEVVRDTFVQHAQIKKFLPILLLLIVGVFFGATTANGKFAAYAGWHPVLFLAISGTFGGVLMMVGLHIAGHRMDFSANVLAFSLVSGVLFAVPNIIFFVSVVHVGAGFVALVTAFASVLTYLFSVALHTEIFKPARAFGIGIALVGAMALSIGKLAGGEFAAVWVLVALAGPVFLAFGNIYRSWAWPEGASPFALAPLMLIVAGLVSFLIVQIMQVSVPAEVSPQMGLTLGLQVLVFAVGFAFYFVLQKIAGAVYLSQIGPVIALVGTGLGISILGEAATVSLLLGGAAIVVGVLIFNFSD